MVMRLFAHSCDSLKEISLLLLNKPALKSFSHNNPLMCLRRDVLGGEGQS